FRSGSPSHSSEKNWVQRVGSQRLCHRHKIIVVLPARPAVCQDDRFYPRQPRSSLHATIGKSEPEYASGKLGNCRGLESPPKGATGFQRIGTGRKRRGI